MVGNLCQQGDIKIEFLHNFRTRTHMHAHILSKGAWEQVNKYLVLIGGCQYLQSPHLGIRIELKISDGKQVEDDVIRGKLKSFGLLGSFQWKKKKKLLSSKHFVNAWQ